VLGPALLVMAPLLAIAPLMALRRLGRGPAHAWMVLTTGGTFLATAALAPAVARQGAVQAELPLLLGRLTFRLDGLGLVVALAATLVWTAATLHASGYLAPAGQARYHVVSLVALSAMLGVVAAGDLLTLYLFFEWLGLIGYLFVVHEGGRDAQRAGVKYLVLTLTGGLALLAGVLVVQALGGGALDAALPAATGREGLRAAAALLLLAGFGVKAGVLGLHIWLPDAHSAAPAPASALLSGVIIKAGAYGIARTLGVLLGGPDGDALGAALAQAAVWVGLATAIAGAGMALWQSHAKRLLAYSSVSQIGFVLTGLGAARLLGAAGADGWTGALAHVMNHALFKGLLFLGVGAAIHAAGSGQLARLGGLARRLPVTFALVLVGTAGIVGLPGTNGFLSKSTLHHALVHAAEHGHGGALAWAEPLFLVGTVGTAAALVKLVVAVFLGRPRGPAPRHGAGAAMPAGMALLAVPIVLLGLAPGLVAGPLGAALAALGLPATDVAGTLAKPLSTPADVATALAALAVGAALYAGLARSGALRRPVPTWLSLDRLATLTVVGTIRAAQRAGRREARWQDVLVHRAWPRLRDRARELARAWQEVGARIGALARRVADRLDRSEHVAERPARQAGPSAVASVARAAAAQSEAVGSAARAAVARSEEERDRLVRATRWQIQRRSRDVGLAVGVIVLVWLLLVLALAAGG
jgi:formate hydrogenlyase subunit 3/multisubunit Na+/H+ antiporter MnhD subunit